MCFGPVRGFGVSFQPTTASPELTSSPYGLYRFTGLQDPLGTFTSVQSPLQRFSAGLVVDSVGRYQAGGLLHREIA